MNSNGMDSWEVETPDEYGENMAWWEPYSSYFIVRRAVSLRIQAAEAKSSCLILPLGDGAGNHRNPSVELHGERFQTSTNRQPLDVSATAPPISQPILQALAIAAGTGTTMFC